MAIPFIGTYSLAFTVAAPVFYAENGDPFAQRKAARAKAIKLAEDHASGERAQRLEDMKTAQPITGKQLSLFFKDRFHHFILPKISAV